MAWSSVTKSFKDGLGAIFTGYMASDGTNVAPRQVLLDGDNVTQGAIADAAATNSTGSWSIVALLKGLYALLAAALPAGSNIIGSVLGRTSKVAVTPTVTTGGVTGATCSFATNVMTCTVAGTGSFAVGQIIVAVGVATGTVITSLGTGTGGIGTYNLSSSPGTIAAEATSAITAYASGNVIGTGGASTGAMFFAGVFDSSNSGILQSIRARSKTANISGINLSLFTANPSNTTWTDKTAPAINSADIANLVGTFTLTNPISALGVETTWELDAIGAAIVSSGTGLWGIATAAGILGFGSTTDITFELTTLKD